MILFLTSSPCDNDVPEHMHLPCCFFTKNDFVKNLKKYFKQRSNCLIICADPLSFQANDEMGYTFRRAFLYHGMEPEDLRLCDARTELHAKDLVEWSDLIILAGGHVPTQNAFFEKIHLKELLHNYEGIVMGVSAGSMNCATTVYAQPEEPGEAVDENYRRFMPGLGLTDLNILPHYQNVKDNILDGKRLYEDIIYEDSLGREFYAMVDGSYILQADGKQTMYGEIYRIKDGKRSQILKEEERKERL